MAHRMPWSVWLLSVGHLVKVRPLARLQDLGHLDNVVALVAHLTISIRSQLLKLGLLLALRADASNLRMPV